MTDKEKKLDKLRKILALAGNNPNKAEAMAAIEKARQYAADYGLTLAEAEATTEYSEYLQRGEFSGDKNFGFVDQFLWKDIARFCHCKVGTGTDSDGDLTLVFFGHKVDVELAHWLRGTIRAAMAFEWGIWRDVILGRDKFRAADMQSFHYGMATELRERMKTVEAAPVDSASTALVVKKWALVEAAAQQHGFEEARGGRGRSIDTSSSSFAGGRDAGKRVDLGRGIANRSVKMIGN